jgi:hypothetical protein
MKEKPIGVLEALALIEAFGEIVLTEDEVAWAEAAADRRGCRFRPDYLTDADRLRIMELGKRCREFRDSRKK